MFQIDIGSGGGAEEEDNSFSFPNTVKKLSNGTDKFEQNPTFTIVSYDLEVPDGIEGPSPVYVKPPSNFNPNISFIDESFLPRTTLNNAIDYNYSVSEKNPITDEETAISSTRVHNFFFHHKHFIFEVNFAKRFLFRLPKKVYKSTHHVQFAETNCRKI